MLGEAIRKLALRLGADKVGFADLSAYEDGFGISRPLTARYPRAISMGVALLDDVVETISPGGPTPLYAHHYRQMNALLDRVALEVARFCASKGFRALPIPASLTVDEERQLGHI